MVNIINHKNIPDLLNRVKEEKKENTAIFQNLIKGVQNVTLTLLFLGDFIFLFKISLIILHNIMCIIILSKVDRFRPKTAGIIWRTNK